MMDDFSILSTAQSSFNNFALVSPFFFLAGILAIPLFLIVYLYGRDFVSRIGWNNQNIDSQNGFWSSLILMLFVLLFGGNYAAIRDGISLLPVVMSIFLFGLTTLLVQKMKELDYIKKIQNYKYKWWLFFVVLLFAGVSASPNWYNILLQISAVLCGVILGSRLRKSISVIPYSVLLYGILLVSILMQPEYFRFGQFDNLTPIHILSVIITGFFGITCLVAKYTNARSKIHESAFVKLKWLCRIMSILAFVLFFMTESVPVFIGLLMIIGILEMLSIYHSSSIAKDLYKQAWALFMICFGIILVCPVISSFGIVYLTFVPTKIKARDFMALL